jgi:hypothetical protein
MAKGWQFCVRSFFAFLTWMSEKYTCAKFKFLKIYDVVYPCRAGVAVTVLGALAVWFLSAGSDVVRGFALSHSCKLFVPAILVGFTTWFMSRATLDLLYDREHGEPKNALTHPRSVNVVVLNWLPRIIAVLPLIGLTMSLIYISWPQQTSFTMWSDHKYLPALAGSFLWLSFMIMFLVQRRKLEEKASRMLERHAPSFSPRNNTTSIPVVFYLLIMAIALVACVPNIINPIYTGKNLGPLGAVFFAAMLFAGAVGGLIYALENIRIKKHVGNTTERFPVMVVLFLISLPLGMLGHGYDVRVLGPLGKDTQTNLKGVFEKWNASPSTDQCKNSVGSKRMIIVATAGGGSRAAYWTATVLGRLADESPVMRNCLFAISGVSGGSLGAVEYVAAQHEVKGQVNEKVEKRLQDSLGHDFLGAVAGALFINDQLFAVLHGFSIKSRADALETSWEEAWARTAPKDARSKVSLASNFFDLWSSEKPWPILILNGTSAETGKRIVTSNIETQGLFTDAYDFFDMSQSKIAASTAAHNSARFSYFSPAGAIVDRSGGYEKRSHIIDGGYFENFGALSAGELISKIKELDGVKNIDFTIIQISSDPDIKLNRALAADCIKPTADELKAAQLRAIDPYWPISSSQYFLPLEGVLQAREGRGVHDADNFQSAYSKVYFHFAMEMYGRLDPPLSWYLSSDSQDNIKALLSDHCSQMPVFDDLLKVLRERK